MSRSIKYLAEPKQLLLAWQAPDHLGDRQRWAVGVIDIAGPECTFRYVTSDPEFRTLNGRSKDDLIALGFLGYPAFGMQRPIHRSEVLPTLMRRLPPRSRPDFGAFLQLYGLAPDANPSDFALLAYTGAKLPSDGFSIVDPLDRSTAKADLVMEVAGTRHLLAGATLDMAPDYPVSLSPEPDNRFDPAAIRVCFSERCVGYVNRLQAETVGYWLHNRAVTASIYRLNGTVQNPKLFIFMSVRPKTDRIAA
ncbi:hypothetical protein GCM10007881_64040 [Mesorhizobium huakuii]|uniref:HIRAN domain-containing protein n=1 Tax=Mesorhizobium huakuii TaxID=28104 RepID=UPI00235D236A|nr:HIRAN domain-containing protein [Mesorhizobium huakuii]GLQ82881.1 hypothetical protein GCM10007881_64040 [Mesorhizobium huakuii]